MKEEILFKTSRPSEIKRARTLTKKDRERLEIFFTGVAQQFLLDHFNMDLTIPVRINGRLTHTLGRYRFDHTGAPEVIELSGRQVALSRFDDKGLEQIEDTLKHELVHYALHRQGLPFDDGEPLFESELKRVGASSSGATDEKLQKSNVALVFYEVVDIVDEFGDVLRGRHQPSAKYVGKLLGYEVVKVQAV